MPRLLSSLRLAALALALTVPAGAQPASRQFVKVRDGQLVVGDRPYHFVGVNLWFGMNLGADLTPGDRARLVRELDRLQAIGVKNLRVMAASEGPATEPLRVVPAVQNSPGVYDERLLRGLDVLLAEMSKRDMRAVLILGNFFQWTGGMSQYVSWVTGKPIPYPEQNGNSWDDFQRFSARFYTLDSAQTLFEKYANTLITRRNSVTGTAYRDDPTIMAWQLSNEPRAYEMGDAFVKWVDRAGSFIHARAPRQLVSLGGEGKLAQETVNTRFEQLSHSRALDYLTMHIWIENWGWYDPTHATETFDRAVGRTMGYLADHVAMASAVGKPLVVEEFGVARDGRDFAASAPVSVRDRFFTIMLESMLHLAAEGSPVAGGNVWSWSGEARPVQAGALWKAGQPFTGDPAHEKQGWYSIYASDSSTIGILHHYASAMDTVALRPWGHARPLRSARR